MAVNRGTTTLMDAQPAATRLVNYSSATAPQNVTVTTMVRRVFLFFVGNRLGWHMAIVGEKKNFMIKNVLGFTVVSVVFRLKVKGALQLQN